MENKDHLTLQDTVNKFGPWMYRFSLSDSIFTPIASEELDEIHQTRKKMIFSHLETMFQNNWTDLKCLDIACNEGFFSFELCKKGVKEVRGFDARPINIEKANLVKSCFGITNADFFVSDINDMECNDMEKSDIVLLLGLLYHVENPMLILRKARTLTKQVCVIDTQILPFNDTLTMAWGLRGKIQQTSNIIGLVQEKSYQSNIAASITGLSFVPNKEALFTMLRYAGFSEIQLIRPTPDSHEQYLNYDRIIVFAK